MDRIVQFVQIQLFALNVQLINTYKIQLALQLAIMEHLDIKAIAQIVF